MRCESQCAYLGPNPELCGELPVGGLPTRCVIRLRLSSIPRLLYRFACRNPASSIRLGESVSTITTFQSLDVLVTCVSVLILLVYYFVLYQPIIRRLDRDIKNVRMLLLLFPDDVSNVVPAIVDAGRGAVSQGVMTAV